MFNNILFIRCLKECKVTLNDHTKRVDELRRMVVQIASDIGIDAAHLLQGEVDALGQRLDNVRESITALADIAEARAENEQDCQRNITEAKAYLNDVQQVCNHSIFIRKYCMIG